MNQAFASRPHEFTPARSAQECVDRGPTREGSVESELSGARAAIGSLGDALQELRSRLSIVLRNTPSKTECVPQQSPTAGPSPVQCTVSAHIFQMRCDIERLRAGVADLLDGLDLN